MAEEETTTPPGQDPGSATTQILTDDPAELKKLLQEEQQRAEGYLANWQRAAADFSNFRRRTEQERSESAKFASSLLVMRLLPVVDDLERALDNVSRDLAGLTWIDGIVLIYRKLLAVLEAEGVKPIEALGQSFDPNLHEAVLREPGEEGKVLAELQKGYTLNGRVIRPTMVKVGNGEGAGTNGQAAG